MLPTSNNQKNLYYSNGAVRPEAAKADKKNKQINLDIENARECGFLSVRNSNIKTLPLLPEGITSIDIQGCHDLVELTGLPSSINTLCVIDCKNIKIKELPATIKDLHLDLKECPFNPEIPEGVEKLRLANCRTSGLPESIQYIEFIGVFCESITQLPSNLQSLKIKDVHSGPLMSIEDLIPETLQELCLVNCPNVELPKKIPSGLTSITIISEQKLFWDIEKENIPSGTDLNLQNVLVSPEILNRSCTTFMGDGTDAVVYFRPGDVVYGLSEPRKKVVKAIEVVNDLSKKDIIIQNTLTNAVWDRRTPRKYKSDALIARALNDKDRGIRFKAFLKKHDKYNITSATFSECNRDQLWSKTSKAGLEFQTLTRNKTVHFCVDGLLDSIKDIANKTGDYGRSITASELRWVYRHQNNEQVMNDIKFYLRGKEISSAQVLSMSVWNDYCPKQKQG